MNETQVVSKNRLIAELSKSHHGKLEMYIPIGKDAAKEDPEWFSHLIAWDAKKGVIRDTKGALPLIFMLGQESYIKQLRGMKPQLTPGDPHGYVSNAYAHLAILNPRELEKSYRFALAHRPTGFFEGIRKMVGRYLRAREANPRWFDRQALQHRKPLQALYALSHTKPSDYAQRALFSADYHKHSVFNTVANLKVMSPTEAAGAIMVNKIPFMTAWRALGAKAKEEATLLALISRMTPTELTTNTKWLTKAGIKTSPVLRAAYEEGLKRAATPKGGKVQLLKTTTAADALEEDDPIREKLRGLQERQIAQAKTTMGIDGDWLVLADKSGSMQHAIEASRHISGTLAKMVKGEVHLVFFDTTPRYMKVTGMDYNAILEKTKAVAANGGTSIGVGLQYILERDISVDGIVVVSDGAENSYPQFAAAYEVASKKWGKKVPVYFYQLVGTDSLIHTQNFMKNCDLVGATPQVFDLRDGKTDYYSLPNLIKTMRVNRYSLLDEIMDTPLLDLDEVLPKVVVA